VRALRWGLVGLVVLIITGYGGVLGYMYLNQRALQYDAQGEITALADAGIAGAQQVAIPVEGVDSAVNAWYAPPTKPGLPLIVYYKGNTGSFTAEYERYAQWVSEGYGFVAFDYHGFPTTPGVISESQILADSIAVYEWAKAQGYPLVIWGRSLGTGPATYVASEEQAGALLLESPFLSAVGVAAERYPFLPVHWVMLDQFRSNEWIADVDEPVYIAHGTDDQTIDVSNGRRLYALAPNPAELWIVEGGTHSDLWDRGLWPQARAFFATAMATAP
jgi:fermentation-respiration switch protein FrsA (DUF1100 family)